MGRGGCGHGVPVGVCPLATRGWKEGHTPARAAPASGPCRVFYARRVAEPTHGDAEPLQDPAMPSATTVRAVALALAGLLVGKAQAAALERPAASPQARAILTGQAPVAQLDRASVYGTEGHRFESCRARHRTSSYAGGSARTTQVVRTTSPKEAV